MKKFLFAFGILLLSVGSFTSVFGQKSQIDSVSQRLREVSNAYKKADHLSFNVVYRYSDQLKPGLIVDSLLGTYNINGNQFYYKIGSSEFIHNDSSEVVIFNDDKVIYVNNGKLVQQSANPVFMIDSVIYNNQYADASIVNLGLIQTLTINYKPDQQFKKVVYVIDGLTSMIISMTATIKSELMYDPALDDMFNKKSEYGILQVLFTNYRKSSFTNANFSTAKFFRRAARSFTGVAPYDKYQIIY